MSYIEDDFELQTLNDIADSVGDRGSKKGIGLTKNELRMLLLSISYYEHVEALAKRPQYSSRYENYVNNLHEISHNPKFRDALSDFYKVYKKAKDAGRTTIEAMAQMQAWIMEQISLMQTESAKCYLKILSMLSNEDEKKIKRDIEAYTEPFRVGRAGFNTRSFVMHLTHIEKVVEARLLVMTSVMVFHKKDKNMLAEIQYEMENKFNNAIIAGVSDIVLMLETIPVYEILQNNEASKI